MMELYTFSSGCLVIKMWILLSHDKMLLFVVGLSYD